MSLSNKEWNETRNYIIEIKNTLVSLDEAFSRRDITRCQFLFDKITTAAQKGLAEVTPIEDIIPR